MGDAVLVRVCARLAREQLGELLVKIDEISGVFLTLELVLRHGGVSNIHSMRNKPSVQSSKGRYRPNREERE